MNPLILALDTDDLDTACSWISATHGSIATYKAGLEFFLKFGEAGIDKLRTAGDFDLFLDLKLHDIPNTVAGAARSISAIAPKFLTVHASGGTEMIQAAATAVPHIEITAVTVLTSLGDEDLREIGYRSDPMTSAIGMADLAVKAGARAIVSSPLEVAGIRAKIGEGVDYFFYTDSKFDQLIAESAFLEWAEFAGARYGTPREPIEHWLALGKNVLLEIEIEGARQVRSADPAAMLIFIAPPSWEELKARLEGRGTDTPERQAARLALAEIEMAAAGEFDHILVNHQVGELVEEMVSLATSHQV